MTKRDANRIIRALDLAYNALKDAPSLQILGYNKAGMKIEKKISKAKDAVLKILLDEDNILEWRH